MRKLLPVVLIGLMVCAAAYAQLFPAGPSAPTVYMSASYSSSAATYQSLMALPQVPPSTNIAGVCDITWEGSSSSAKPTFALGLSAAPTDLYVTASYDNGAFVAPTFTTIASTTTTAVTGSLTTTTATTAYFVHLAFMLLNASTANTLTLYVESSSTSYSIIVQVGSHCQWLP